MSARARLDRLRRLTRAEAAFRVRGLARRTADRVAVKVRPSAWRRDSLAAALTPETAGGVRALLTAGRFEEAHHAIAAHVRQRPVRSLLHPSLRAALRARVLAACPGAVDDARTRGDRLVNGDYDLLGYEGLRFDGHGGGVDWHRDPVSGRRAPRLFWADVPYLDPASGDHKVIWELNRHQHWLGLGRAWWLTGDHRYRARMIAEASGWMAANPPLVGVNWASSLELGFRTIAWTWAIELFADGDVAGEPPWLVDLLLGLVTQLRQIERNLSWYFSPNTHLLGEALALYVCGRTWPEFVEAARWEQIGGDILLGEIDRQVLADGFHAEQSTHYHRYALEFYLLALATARSTGDEPRAAAFGRAAGQMATALREVTDAAGRVPLIGDDDGGELFPLAGHTPDDVRPTLAWAAALLDRSALAMGPPSESALWLTASLERGAAPMLPTASAPQQSAILPASGYHVSRRNEALLVFDAGAHGFMNAGHAHADALAVTLSAGAHRLLVDPGTGTYTMDRALRDRFRSSALHNTVTIDGRSQSVPAGPFDWSHAAGARAERAVIGATFDLFHASTDAYAPVRHERLVFATGAHTWIVADRLAGAGRHRASVHWHIDPEWGVAADGWGGWALTRIDGEAEARLSMPEMTVELFRGDAGTGLGWVAPVYGRVTAATTLRGRTEGLVPFWTVTTIDVGMTAVGRAVTSRLEVLSSDPDGSACAVVTRRARHMEVTVFRTARDRDTVTVTVEPRGEMAITTDAAALHARISAAGRLERVCLVDATVFRFDGRAPVTMTCPAPIADLDVRLDEDGAAVVSSASGQADVAISSDAPVGRQPGRDAPPLERSLLQQ